MVVRKSPGKGVFKQGSEYVGGIWVKKGNPKVQKSSAITFPMIFSNNSNLKTFLYRKDETSFTGKQEFQQRALVMGSAQVKFVS